MNFRLPYLKNKWRKTKVDENPARILFFGWHEPEILLPVAQNTHYKTLSNVLTV